MDIKEILKIISIMEGKNEIPVRADEDNHGLCIVVIDNGFVFVGDLVTDNKWATITNARPIIRWGTSNGLTELANKGPLENTKLGESQNTCNVTPISRLLNILSCNKDLWRC